MWSRFRIRLVVSGLLAALVGGVVFAATFQLVTPSTVKAVQVHTEPSDILGMFSDPEATQPVFTLDFGEIMTRSCSTKAHKLFVKNMSSELRVENIRLDVPFPSNFGDVLEDQSIAQRSDGTPYNGGVVETGEVITMFVWLCDVQSRFIGTEPVTIDLDLRLHADVIAAP